MEKILSSRRLIFVVLLISVLFLFLSPLSLAETIWMPTVCIDAGHGGKYTGAISPINGLLEKDVNLDIALRVRALLGAQGYNVVMTRTADTEVNRPPVDRTGDGRVTLSDELQARCDVANSSAAQVFVSIHNNAAGGSGTETYYWSAQTDFQSAQYSYEGKVLATLIQEEVVKKTGLYNRGVKGYNFYVLRNTHMPSALVEGAFLDDPAEAKLLATESFRQLIAEGVVNGIVRYLTGRCDNGAGDEQAVIQYFTWYDYRSTGMNGNWVLIGNPSTTAAAKCDIYIGGFRINDSTFYIPPGSKVTPTYRSVMNGPVKVKSKNGVPVFSSQRVLYKDSFNEITGISREALSTEFYFTWYDFKSLGMNGNWVLVGNPSLTETAQCDIYIGSKKMGSYLISPGGKVTPTYRGVMNGPVIVRSTNRVPVFCSQRVLYKDSFNEVSGIPKEALSTEFYFTWYDFKSPGMNGNWVLVGNPASNSSSAQVDIYIGPVKRGSYTISPGSAVTPVYPGVMDGPVRVVCTNGLKIFASQRVLYQDSFNEVLGVPVEDLSTEFYFTWYDYKSVGMNGNWVLIGNLSPTKTADCRVYIGNKLMGSYSVPPEGRVTPVYPGVMNGPVQVVCTNGVNILSSQRVIYKSSFEEVPGIRLRR